MSPTYRAGDRVLVHRYAYRTGSPAAGDIVVVRDPEHRGRVLIKRVARDPGCGHANDAPDVVYVLGDNTEASRDSRHFGPVPRSQVLGRVILKY
jgi:signal peptidase I